MTDIRIKRGETLLLSLLFTDDTGVAINLASVTLAAQLRDASDNLVAVLPIVLAASTGYASITVADTTLWPLGLLRGDIRLTTNGLPVLSETFSVRVNRQVTR